MLPCLIGLRASPRSSFSLPDINCYRCGPCGIVGNALASVVRAQRQRPCHGNPLRASEQASHSDHGMATAASHPAVASARKVRSVDREIRWALKIECILDGGVDAEEALRRPGPTCRCILRSRRRMALIGVRFAALVALTERSGFQYDVEFLYRRRMRII